MSTVTERPLTVADRAPQLGDVIRTSKDVRWRVGDISGKGVKGWRWFTNIETGIPARRKVGEFPHAVYVSRADNGPTTVPIP